MIIGIDASNIRTGGGKKQLEEFVNYTINNNKHISFIVVSNKNINSLFKDTKAVKCITNKLLNSNSFFSLISQFLMSKYYFKKNKCRLVFAPGGIFLSSFRPFFTMSQNMLPFDSKEIKNFSFNKRIKFRLIKILQLISFNNSNGVIFLTEYARSVVEESIRKKINSIVIPHGIEQKEFNTYSNQNIVFNILYVSDFLPYKHNLNVFRAAVELISEGLDINLTLIGKKDNSQYPIMKEELSKNPNLFNKINIVGQISPKQITKYYEKASLFLFASSCENLPFIILEALSYGLPIITTNKSPMKDLVYGDQIFFDSYNKDDIKEVIRQNFDKEKLKQLSINNYRLSKKYTWKNNVNKTLNFFNSYS